MLLAGTAFAILWAPSHATALDLNDTVCDVRQTLSLLLEPCPEEPAPPTTQPTVNKANRSGPVSHNAAPNTTAKPVRSARAAATTPQSPPLAQTPRQMTPEPQQAPVATVLTVASHTPVPAWREGLIIGMTALAAVLMLWLLIVRPRRRGEVQAIDQLKDDLVSNLTHELRTPLTPLIGYPQMLADGRLRGSQVRRVAEQMMSASRQLERRIDALVTYATLRRGALAPGTDVVDFAELLRGIAERSGDGRVFVRVDGSVPQVRCDERLVTLAVQELVDNALKFSPDGGDVQIVASRFAGRDHEATVEISVVDHGIGLSPADLAAAFEEFRQLDASSTRRFGGIGLGLTLADQIARLHGGEVRASSTPGHGSVMTFSIPERLALSSAVPVHAA